MDVLYPIWCGDLGCEDSLWQGSEKLTPIPQFGAYDLKTVQIQAKKWGNLTEKQATLPGGTNIGSLFCQS